MKKTEYFETLPIQIKEFLMKVNNLESLLAMGNYSRIYSNEEQSEVFKIENEKLILKIYKPEGKRSVDIEALLDLSEMECFPRLYAYEEGKCLLMEEVPGEELSKLLRSGKITNEELLIIRDQYKTASIEALKKNRNDADFKVEHIFWDRVNKKIKLIDLGYYEKDTFYYPSFEEIIKEKMNYIDKKIIKFCPDYII